MTRRQAAVGSATTLPGRTPPPSASSRRAPLSCAWKQRRQVAAPTVGPPLRPASWVAGPVGARNTSGATSNTETVRRPSAHRAGRPRGRARRYRQRPWGNAATAQFRRNAPRVASPGGRLRGLAAPAARQLGVRDRRRPEQPRGQRGDGASQAERPASSVARCTPLRPASCAAWVRHEKPSARYTASGWADRDGSSE